MERRIRIVCFISAVYVMSTYYTTCSNATPTSILHFRVKYHDGPFAFQRRPLGSVEIEIGELLELGEGKKGSLFSNLKLSSAEVRVRHFTENQWG